MNNQPSEDGLIAIMKSALATTRQGAIVGIGDDCAVLAPPPAGNVTLCTTDMLVEGTHFRLEWSSPWQIGYKAVAANVSDIFAMGGRPASAVISIGIRPRKREYVTKHMYEGIAAAATKYGVAIVGGDTVKSELTTISITMLGTAPEKKVLLRRGASPGDIVCVTATCGDSAAGLGILLAKGKTNLTKPEEILVERHLVPQPDATAAGLIAASGVATACMDLSDGLSHDLARLCSRSGTGAAVEASAIPLSRELVRYCKTNSRQASDYALHGGEDYNLLFTTPPQDIPALEAMAATSRVRITRIGTITTAEKGLTLLRGTPSPWPGKGFRHF